MKPYIDKTVLSILETVLSEALYRVELRDQEVLPATIDLSNEYILELFSIKKRLAASSMEGYLLCYREFLRNVNKPLTQITQEDIEHYFRQKMRAGNTGRTINNKRRMLNALYKWMRQNKFVTENPVENIEPYVEIRKPVEHLRPEDVELLKEACKNKRDRALLEWLRCTATRKGEIPDVKINQIDWRTEKVIIFGSKTNEYRTVCLDPVAIQYLLAYIEERGLDTKSSEPLFVRLRGKEPTALRGSGIYSEIKRLAQAAGLEQRVYPHLFRKTTATNIVRRGGSDLEAGLYLGHKPQGVTEGHYIARTEDMTEKVFRDFVAAV